MAQKNSVIIKCNKYGLIVILDENMPFEQLLKDVGDKFTESSNFFKDAKMAVSFRGRVLTRPEEKAVVQAIVNHSQIHIMCIIDEMEEHENYYHKAVELAEEEQEKMYTPFYYGTLRSGQELEMEHSVVILGDVNPGAKVVSKGNIVVLGTCMGNLYAGASGNRDCFCAALVLKAMQIRIADKMVRSGITKRADTGEYSFDPKIAYINEEHIRIKPIGEDAWKDILSE